MGTILNAQDCKKWSNERPWNEMKEKEKRREREREADDDDDDECENIDR